MWQITASCLLVEGDGVCQREMEPFKDRPEYLRMSDKPQKQDTAKAAWATFSTNLCLNCLLMCTAIL